MATPIPTDLASILLAAKNRLISQGVLRPNAVYIGLNAEIPSPPPADQFAVLVPTTQVVDQGAVTGGGNDAMLMVGDLDIWLWSRCNTDEVPRSEQWLTNTSLGALGTVRSMVVALQMWQPTDTSGNGLVYVPLKLQTIEQGKRLSEKNSTQPPGWGNMVSRWRFKWQFKLT